MTARIETPLTDNHQPCERCQRHAAEAAATREWIDEIIQKCREGRVTDALGLMEEMSKRKAG